MTALRPTKLQGLRCDTLVVVARATRQSLVAECSICHERRAYSDSNLARGWARCQCRHPKRVRPGMRFGRWMVWERKGMKALARCDCGAVKWVDAYSLAEGRSQSCRCRQRQQMRRHNPNSAAGRLAAAAG